MANKSMQLKETEIEGLVIAVTKYTTDKRGAFARLFCIEELTSLSGDHQIQQINYSINKSPGLIRGMHYQQQPYAEMKFVRCIKGSIWDVGIDLRRDSPTFLQWHAEVLTEGDGKMMIIPEGFAHGFQVLKSEAEILYLHTMAYHPEAEGGLNPLDPVLKINWPLPVAEISDRDLNHPMITKQFKGV